MAKAKIELNREYINVTATDFTAEVQEMLRLEREMYDMMKEHKAKIVAAIRKEVPVPAGRVIGACGYTAWGQMQLTVQDVATPKAGTSGSRPSLADFIAAQSHGQRLIKKA